MDNRFTIHLEDEWPYSPLFQDFANFLGLSAIKDGKGVWWGHDQKVKDRIKEIYQWGVVQSESKDMDKVKIKVYELIRSIGTNWTGQTLVEKLWQHLQFDSSYKARIDMLSAQIEEDKKEEKLQEVNQYIEEREQKVLETPQKATPADGKEVIVPDSPKGIENKMKIPEAHNKPSEPQPI